MNRGAWALVVVGALGLAGCGGGGQKSSAGPAIEAPEPDDDDERDDHRASAPGEEDDDEGLEIEGLRGRLDVYDIKEGIRPHETKLSRCYTGKLGKRRYIGGDIELAFVVVKDGSVKTVAMSKSDLGSWAMEQCMLDIARKISFASPKGGPEAEFTVPLSFSPTRSVSWWDQARAETEVQDKLQELGECADKAGIAAPDEVWITLYIGTRGQVQSAGFASATPLADEWATCAADKATAWVLSDPRGRVAKMTFRYAPE